MMGAQVDPFLVSVPRWLRELTARLGVPEVDHHGTMRRWLWRDGEVGVVLDRATRVWQLVAFTPRASVTFRSEREPTEAEIRAAAVLANLDDLHDEPGTRS